jgi:vancomycin resistance protein YoaR
MAHPTVLRFVVAGAFLGVVAGGGVWARERLVPEGSALLPGLRVDGVTVPEGTDVRAFVEERAALLRARRVKLVVNGETYGHAKESGARVLGEATLGDLGVTVDVDAVVAAARGVGRDTDLVTAFEERERAARGEIDVPLAPTVDARAALPRLEGFKEDTDIAPVSARLDLDHHAVVPEKAGQYLDAYGAVAALEAAARAPGYANDAALVVIDVPMQPFTPRVSTELLSQIEIGDVVATFETPFSRAQGNRSRNIEVALSRVNGVVLSPGQTMSFNEVVGPRSVENGFQHAGEIFKGEMVDGVGGGTCQAASTLHAAAFFGGLDILERLPHSRPSAYIELGLDATVVYPAVDLKLRNPYDFPIVIHAWIDGNKAKVELLGARHPVTVKFGKTYLASFAFGRKVSEEPSVTKPTLKQKGMRGVQIRRSRVIDFTDGEPERIETSVDTYPPVQEVYKVPPGYDPEELPALGEDENAAATPATKPGETKKNDSREGAPAPG